MAGTELQLNKMGMLKHKKYPVNNQGNLLEIGACMQCTIYCTCRPIQLLSTEYAKPQTSTHKICCLVAPKKPTRPTRPTPAFPDQGCCPYSMVKLKTKGMSFIKKNVVLNGHCTCQWLTVVFHTKFTGGAAMWSLIKEHKLKRYWAVNLKSHWPGPNFIELLSTNKFA